MATVMNNGMGMGMRCWHSPRMPVFRICPAWILKGSTFRFNIVFNRERRACNKPEQYKHSDIGPLSYVYYNATAVVSNLFRKIVDLSIPFSYFPDLSHSQRKSADRQCLMTFAYRRAATLLAWQADNPCGWILSVSSCFTALLISGCGIMRL